MTGSFSIFSGLGFGFSWWWIVSPIVVIAAAAVIAAMLVDWTT